jgi:hypothetical protein
LVPGIASLLVVASAAIVLVLGTLHLLYTFRGNKLDPREPGLRQAMEQSTPRITRETTVWRAWVGFNATHSLGLMLFALIYAYLALAAPALLFGSLFLQGLGLVLLTSYVVLARRYFFSVPFRGIVLATLLYAAGLAAAAA